MREAMRSWLQKMPGSFYGATHDAAIAAAAFAFDPLADAGAFGVTLKAMGHEPQMRNVHGDVPGHVWILPLPAPGQ